MSDHQTPYAPHQAFIAPAWTRSERWRIAVMIICFEVAFFTLPPILASLLGPDGAEAFYDGVTTWATLLQFGIFGLVGWAFVIVLRIVHARGFWSLIGAPEQALADLWRVVLGVGFLLLVLEFLPPWLPLSEMAEIRDPLWWALMIVPGLIVLLLQVGTEEIYFRGYLQQQLACLSSSRLIWMVLPSMIFGFAHYGNGEGTADSTLWMIWATALGLACADLTARTGTLGAAIGLHLANNFFALMVLGIEGQPASGLALFLYPAIDREGFDFSAQALATPGAMFELAIMCMTVLVMWLAARIALRR
ncbi:CPBP family intramembrane glutamic endopeptidase [Yoonia sp. 2307UL14-13]|uniref:CPBP family intramembrane glutamic endopeptidase n=1 Tax=Yoonia sp. 2307UL14-13 TaxID=3126506 RepID=UPI003096E0C5